MRVRTFELRLIAIALLIAWSATAGLLLVAYRPGGPVDGLVGLTALGPIGIAGLSVVWPPVTRGDRSFTVMVWLGIGALLCLIPSIGGFWEQIRALGTQTLLPSLEAAYPWFLALLATSLFSGFGLARRLLGQTAMRRRRLVRGLVMGTVLTVITGSAFAAAALANEIALRGTVTAASRFGPTDIDAEPPLCDGPLEVGSSARLNLRLSGAVDLGPIGSVELSGWRSGVDFRWLAYIATDRELGWHGVAVIGDRGWSLRPGTGWRTTSSAVVATETVDVRILELALPYEHRTTAEDRGLEIIEGARARRCRVAIDGETFWAAFPQVQLLLGVAPDLRRWRGQLDYWVFLDGQLGQVVGSASGDATGIEPGALLASVEIHMTATERGRPTVIYPPGR
jgi:hypothetical protein